MPFYSILCRNSHQPLSRIHCAEVHVHSHASRDVGVHRDGTCAPDHRMRAFPRYSVNTATVLRYCPSSNYAYKLEIYLPTLAKTTAALNRCIRSSRILLVSLCIEFDGVLRGTVCCIFPLLADAPRSELLPESNSQDSDNQLYSGPRVL